MTGKDEERNQPNLAKLVEFSLKFLVLSVAVRFSADWSYSASTGSLFGGSLQINDLTQGDGPLGVVFAVTFWLLKWSWGLVLIVLFGTMLPSSFFSSKAGIRRTVMRGIAGSGFIISRMLLGPLPVMLVFTLWGGVILVTGDVLKELDASGVFHVSKSLRNWSYFSLLTIVGDVLELFAFLIAGVVLVRGYRIGEERLSTAQE